MKYFFGEITEIFGEYEGSYPFLFVVDESENEDAIKDKILLNWRGSNENDWDDNFDGYWFDGNIARWYGSREIPEDDFNVLKKYLAVL